MGLVIVGKKCILLNVYFIVDVVFELYFMVDSTLFFLRLLLQFALKFY